MPVIVIHRTHLCLTKIHNDMISDTIDTRHPIISIRPVLVAILSFRLNKKKTKKKKNVVFCQTACPTGLKNYNLSECTAVYTVCKYLLLCRYPIRVFAVCPSIPACNSYCNRSNRKNLSRFPNSRLPCNICRPSLENIQTALISNYSSSSKH